MAANKFGSPAPQKMPPIFNEPQNPSGQYVRAYKARRLKRVKTVVPREGHKDTGGR